MIRQRSSLLSKISLILASVSGLPIAAYLRGITNYDLIKWTFVVLISGAYITGMAAIVMSKNEENDKARAKTTAISLLALIAASIFVGFVAIAWAYLYFAFFLRLIRNIISS